MTFLDQLGLMDMDDLLELTIPCGFIFDKCLVMRPQFIPKKHFTNKAIAIQLERAIKVVASGRCGGLEIDVDHDAHKFVACMMCVIEEGPKPGRWSMDSDC